MLLKNNPFKKVLLYEQLTITGKKYFSTVPVVRTSAQDPKGLKNKQNNTCMVQLASSVIKGRLKVVLVN